MWVPNLECGTVAVWLSMWRILRSSSWMMAWQSGGAAAAAWRRRGGAVAAALSGSVQQWCVVCITLTHKKCV